jgi:DNA-directed RNA polymerase specialized sigma24 family protein
MSSQPSENTYLYLIALTRKAGAGDAEALDALARRAQPILESHARRALGRQLRTACDVEDLVAELVAEVQAFLAAGGPDGPGWRRFEASRGQGELTGWLFGIVRNKVRRRLRDLRRHAELAGMASSDPAGWREPVAPERALDGARALALVRRLPVRERDALSLWLADAPSREIAARLRFASPHAVDCCLARGKRRLREMMEMDGALLRAA